MNQSIVMISYNLHCHFKIFLMFINEKKKQRQQIKLQHSEAILPSVANTILVTFSRLLAVTALFRLLLKIIMLRPRLLQ